RHPATVCHRISCGGTPLILHYHAPTTIHPIKMRAATQVAPTAHERPCPAKINPIRSTAIVNRLTIFDPLWEAGSSAQFQFARGMVLRCALDAAIEALPTHCTSARWTRG